LHKEQRISAADQRRSGEGAPGSGVALACFAVRGHGRELAVGNRETSIMQLNDIVNAAGSDAETMPHPLSTALALILLLVRLWFLA